MRATRNVLNATRYITKIASTIVDLRRRVITCEEKSVFVVLFDCRYHPYLNEFVSSDTVTQPTTSMRSKMFSAVVGDSVYDEDPTVLALERMGAEIVGKDFSIFMPSATMSNLCAAFAHCQRGDRVILGSKSHMFLWEQGGLCSVAGCVMHPLVNSPDGMVLNVCALYRINDIMVQFERRRTASRRIARSSSSF